MTRLRLLIVAAAAAVLALPAVAAGAESPAQRAVAIAKASLAGRHDVRWAALHPKYRANAPKARFVACERKAAAGVGKIVVASVQAEGTSVYHTSMPGLGKVDVNDVTLAITFRRGGSTQLAEVDSLWVLYKGRWVQLYSPDEYKAYAAGKCP